MSERNAVVIPAGTVIHVGGLPFEMKTDTVVYGHADNLAEGLQAIAAAKAADRSVVGAA